jgi:hypothetical protein
MSHPAGRFIDPSYPSNYLGPRAISSKFAIAKDPVIELSLSGQCRNILGHSKLVSVECSSSITGKRREPVSADAVAGFRAFRWSPAWRSLFGGSLPSPGR